VQRRWRLSYSRRAGQAPCLTLSPANWRLRCEPQTLPRWRASSVHAMSHHQVCHAVMRSWHVRSVTCSPYICSCRCLQIIANTLCLTAVDCAPGGDVAGEGANRSLDRRNSFAGMLHRQWSRSRSASPDAMLRLAAQAPERAERTGDAGAAQCAAHLVCDCIASASNMVATGGAG
jgi:hypothetical protein